MSDAVIDEQEEALAAYLDQRPGLALEDHAPVLTDVQNAIIETTRQAAFVRECHNIQWQQDLHQGEARVYDVRFLSADDRGLGLEAPRQALLDTFSYVLIRAGVTQTSGKYYWNLDDDVLTRYDEADPF